jgi:hypothetical protein
MTLPRSMRVPAKRRRRLRLTTPQRIGALTVGATWLVAAIAVYAMIGGMLHAPVSLIPTLPWLVPTVATLIAIAGPVVAGRFLHSGWTGTRPRPWRLWGRAAADASSDFDLSALD